MIRVPPIPQSLQNDPRLYAGPDAPDNHSWHRVNKPYVHLRETASDQPHIMRGESQLLFGEYFNILSEDGDWVFGYSYKDFYQGYVPKASLTKTGQIPAYDMDVSYITSPYAPVFPEPTLKTIPLGKLYMGSLLLNDDLGPQEGNYQYITTLNGWIHMGDISKESQIKQQARQPLDVALQFLNAPYIYGGRHWDGIDCSGLIQTSLFMCGHAVLRDTDMQAQTIGETIDIAPSDSLSANVQAGDLVYFPGHVGIMFDPETLLHATGSLAPYGVRLDPLRAVEQLYEDGITAVRRPVV